MKMAPHYKDMRSAATTGEHFDHDTDNDEIVRMKMIMALQYGGLNNSGDENGDENGPSLGDMRSAATTGKHNHDDTNTDTDTYNDVIVLMEMIMASHYGDSDKNIHP